MKQVWYVNLWEKRRKMFGVLVGEHEGKRLLSILRCRLENNIKMGLKGLNSSDADRNHRLAAETEQQ